MLKSESQLQICPKAKECVRNYKECLENYAIGNHSARTCWRGTPHVCKVDCHTPLDINCPCGCEVFEQGGKMTEEKKEEKVIEFSDLNLEQLVANKDSDKLSRLIDEWEGRIRAADVALQIINEDLTLQNKELVELRNTLAQKRQEQLETEQTVRKGLHTLRQLNSEKRGLERAYWRAK
jgi:hypothetical protein